MDQQFLAVFRIPNTVFQILDTSHFLPFPATMIKHLVFWKLKDEAEGATRDENARKICDMLFALKAHIPELLEIDCGIDFNRSPAAFDVALHTAFKDKAALQAYIDHPEHDKVRIFISKVVSGRAVVDYEV